MGKALVTIFETDRTKYQLDCDSFDTTVWGYQCIQDIWYITMNSVHIFIAEKLWCELIKVYIYVYMMTRKQINTVFTVLCLVRTKQQHGCDACDTYGVYINIIKERYLKLNSMHIIMAEKSMIWSNLSFIYTHDFR